VAVAGPKSPGASVRPYVSIRPARPGPAVRPRIRVPSLGDHVARRVLKKHRARTRTRWTGSWHTEFVSPRGRAARNRRNFLSLLQVPLRPAAPAAGAPAARPSFGAGLRSGIFEPNSADAHDRYANMEASYLLSRMPRHRPAAALTKSGSTIRAEGSDAGCAAPVRPTRYATTNRGGNASGTLTVESGPVLAGRNASVSNR
jgi:hypothetical protein